MDKIDSVVYGAKKIAISGHVRPDGDCVGACSALYQYLIKNKKVFGIEKVEVFLEPFGNEYHILTGTDKFNHTYESDDIYDLFISLDCASLDRLGKALKFFETAKKTLNIDHHISNMGFAKVNHLVAEASSTCEVLFTLLEEDQITKEIAEALYVGIIHDTGVFKHSNTSEKTMVIAGKLIRKGIDSSTLIDESFYTKTHLQNQILGRCLMESSLLLDGKIVFASLTRDILNIYGAVPSDLDGIIDQLRVTKGTEVAIFIYEIKPQELKVSMRSNGEVNVSNIAVHFGGGGHIKAAGCSMTGSVSDCLDSLIPLIEAQLKEIRSTGN